MVQTSVEEGTDIENEVEEDILNHIPGLLPSSEHDTYTDNVDTTDEPFNNVSNNIEHTGKIITMVNGLTTSLATNIILTIVYGAHGMPQILRSGLQRFTVIQLTHSS